jgi:hypothetical protein
MANPVFSPQVPVVRGSSIIGFVEAVRRLGDDAVARTRAELDPNAARRVFDELLLPAQWLPERDLIDLCEAVYQGPLARAHGPYMEYLGRGIDLGWGRVQRALVGFATPKMLAERAAKLWRKEHSHGTLDVEVAGKRAMLVLRDHPFCETQFSRALIAELLRYILSLTRVGEVQEAHALESPGVLRMTLTW